MIIVGIIFLACMAAIIWGLYFENMVADTVLGKVLASLILLPLCVVCAVFISFLCVMFFSIPTLFMDKETVKTDPVAIYSLSDNSGISGSFVLGSGRVESDLYYYYIVDTDAGKSVQSVKASDGYIVESNESSTVVYQSVKLKSKFWNAVLLDLNSIGDSKVILTVPENTIIEQYSIDLQ